MSILELYGNKSTEASGDLASHADLKRKRSEILHDIQKVSRLDVIVVGGGIQGAMFARLAAFNGLKVLLLEINDYASGTSGRTSKMAHGGLRYLEYFDFKQVMEGVKSREEFYRTASHLVKPQEFYIPIYKGQFFKRIKLALGLTFYDLFLRKKTERHSWVKKDSANLPPLAEKKGVSGFIRFFDGLMHDVRLVLENIYTARQEGALCLNYARVDSIYQKNSSTEVAWTDILTGEKYTSNTGIVVNTAGAWAPLIGRITPDKGMPEVRYSQGTHLFFDRTWDKPALLMPLPGKGRNYFIWPHPAGTLVGTTEKDLPSPQFDPIPSKEEIQELLDRIAADLPNAGLNRENLFHAYAGIRTLPGAKGSKETFKLSRRHIWRFSQGVLTLLGGKYTSAGWTANEGLGFLYKYAGIKRPVIPLSGRKLPGAYNYENEVNTFKSKCLEKGVPPSTIDSCIRRLGARVKILSELDPSLKLIGGKILEADLKLALYYEQAESLDDLFSRRLDLEVEKDGGLALLQPVCEFLKGEKPEIDWDSQAKNYRERISSLRALLK
jgi:glycerol-3-phosphate dehydrogenase